MTLPPLFNPSNDMALAANVRQYTPPRHIRKMEEDLALLARLWDEGPWGWSLSTKQRYRQMGVTEADLPTDEWLREIRRLSSREFGVAYYRELGKGWDALVPCQSRFCQTMDEVREMTERADGDTMEPTGDGRFIAKAPWSSSGRGNIIIGNKPNLATQRRIHSIIRQQGGIVVEPFYANKVMDFAMEFQAGEEGVRFLGYSVFFADEMGHYCGNWVESQEQLRRHIDLPEVLLQGLIDHHREKLSALPYRGPVGIDMMRLRDGRVHPCVEVNFRMTMGLLAIFLYNKGIRDDQALTPESTRNFVSAIQHGRLCIIPPVTDKILTPAP